jgi:nicotinic acid mononucleotide adenylyltransferase
VAIAHAALCWADEVLLMLPRSFPHKVFEGAAFEDRIDMLNRIAASEQRISVASCEGGLYLEMADETADYFGTLTEIGLVCGRDAAERIVSWDYGRVGVFEEMLERYPLLVAGRAGDFLPAPEHVHRIVNLPMDASFNVISSSEIRRLIALGEAWRHLVPEPIVSRVAKIYPAKNQGS